MGRRKILPYPSDRRGVDQLIEEYEEPLPEGPEISFDPLVSGLPMNENEYLQEDATDAAVVLNKIKKHVMEVGLNLFGPPALSDRGDDFTWGAVKKNAGKVDDWANGLIKLAQELKKTAKK